MQLRNMSVLIVLVVSIVLFAMSMPSPQIAAMSSAASGDVPAKMGAREEWVAHLGADAVVFSPVHTPGSFRPLDMTSPAHKACSSWASSVACPPSWAADECPSPAEIYNVCSAFSAGRLAAPPLSFPEWRRGVSVPVFYAPLSNLPDVLPPKAAEEQASPTAKGVADAKADLAERQRRMDGAPAMSDAEKLLLLPPPQPLVKSQPESRHAPEAAADSQDKRREAVPLPPLPR